MCGSQHVLAEWETVGYWTSQQWAVAQRPVSSPLCPIPQNQPLTGQTLHCLDPDNPRSWQLAACCAAVAVAIVVVVVAAAAQPGEMIVADVATVVTAGLDLCCGFLEGRDRGSCVGHPGS